MTTTKTWRDMTAEHLSNWLTPGHPVGENDTGTASCRACDTHEERRGAYDEMEAFIDRFYAEHQHREEAQ